MGKGLPGRAHFIVALSVLAGVAAPVPAQQVRLLPPVEVMPSGAHESQVLLVQEKAPEKKEKDDLFKLDLERLLQVPVAPATPAAPTLSPQQLVSTVTRQESTVGQSPTAIFVITQDMIRRSGATSIPEALRMAPGLQVARIDSSRWAITARGFNERFAGKLLVQIDGRIVYNILFSGVYWDTQDLLLEDVERIEVIRGPGATIWGANAVNGVINIITKKAQDTQGGLVVGGGGTFDRTITGLRYGGKIGDDLYYRVWGKWFERGPGFSPFGPTHDDWRQGRGGFRLDWQASERDAITLQGDLFEGDSGRQDTRVRLAAPFFFTNIEDEHSWGSDVLFRWRHDQDKESGWTLQAYWDRFHRAGTNGTFGFDSETIDVDFQQQFPLGSRHKVVYGLGYRWVHLPIGGSTFDNGFAIGNAERSTDLYTAFVQDEIALREDALFLTLGSKFEHNAFTGFEVQPTVRLLWKLSERRSAWTAVSRAVRIPNIGEQNLSSNAQPPIFGSPLLPPGASPGAPLFPVFVPPKDLLAAEDLIAYEAGYRAQPTEKLSYDLAVFCNVYDNLIGPRASAVIPGPVAGTFVLPFARFNGLSAEGYGAELAVNYRLHERWRLYGAYTLLHLFLHEEPGLRSTAETFEGVSPHNQVYLQSSWDLGCKFEFDLIGRYVETLPGFDPHVPSYITLDARLAWRPRRNLELAVVGQNLLDSHHLESGTSQVIRGTLVEIPRGVYGQATWRW